MKKTTIRTFYQADPLGVVPGGIDTFLRGLFKWAPDDLEFSLVGMTTEPGKRPVGRWTRCSLGRREFDFFPAFAELNPGGRSKVPLTLRLTYGAARYRAEVMQGHDVFEVHRIEPLLLFRNDRRPKNAFFHNDRTIVRTAKTDIRWRNFPGAYFWLERRLVRQLSSAFCVHREGVRVLRDDFPSLADQINFVPTWVDTEVFHPAESPEARDLARSKLRTRCAFAADARLIVTVGRLDTSKNPELLLEAFALLAAQRKDVVLGFVGDGVLRPTLEGRVRQLGLADRVHFFGLCPPGDISEILRAADIFALSSAYEGMPMALLEALGSGVPVVTTDVGEVRKVVSDRSGMVVTEHSPRQFCAALDAALSRLPELSGPPCLDAIQQFQPAAVLEPVYENYRRLGGQPGFVGMFSGNFEVFK